MSCTRTNTAAGCVSHGGTQAEATSLQLRSNVSTSKYVTPTKSVKVPPRRWAASSRADKHDSTSRKTCEAFVSVRSSTLTVSLSVTYRRASVTFTISLMDFIQKPEVQSATSVKKRPLLAYRVNQIPDDLQSPHIHTGLQ